MDQLLTEERIADVKRAEASAGTWSRVVRLIEAHPDVKQVRLNINEHSVTVGFYETPSEETLNQIKTEVRAELSSQWDVSIKPDDKSPTVHLHRTGNYTTEFHRAHPADEPPVICAGVLRQRDGVAQMISFSFLLFWHSSFSGRNDGY
jgi:hypothetical protein